MFYFFFSVFFCLMSYINMDPMKSSFFLVLSLLFSMPFISFYFYIWFSYFICLLFLSGIFVILVYFSSLSSISSTKVPLSSLIFVLTFFSFFPFYFFYYTSLSINNFYLNVYWSMLVFVILILLVFMNFTSYFLNFSGALRKY